MQKKELDPESTVQISKEELDKIKNDTGDSKAGCLIIIKGVPHGKIYQLESDEILIGRDSKDASVAIRVNDTKVSRKHTKIVKEGAYYKISDLNSTNGTFLNDSRLTPDPLELKNQDEIKIGDTIFKFFTKGSAELDSLAKAVIDGLTNIYNRKFISDSLEVEFKRAKVLGHPLSLIVFDIDNFKKINDTYGHDAGDLVLKDVTKTVKLKQVRLTDILGRYGGEEFLVILPETNQENAKSIAERIRKNIEESTFNHNNVQIKVTISLGVSTYTGQPEIDSEHVLFKNADNALYESKHTGKNKVTAH